MVDAVSGEGRTGRVGLVSILNDRIKDNESGIGAPFPRKGELPTLLRRILCVCLIFFFSTVCPAYAHTYISRPIGRRAGGPARYKARSAK
jgi:hypothetical protein